MVSKSCGLIQHPARLGPKNMTRDVEGAKKGQTPKHTYRKLLGHSTLSETHRV